MLERLWAAVDQNGLFIGKHRDPQGSAEIPNAAIENEFLVFSGGIRCGRRSRLQEIRVCFTRSEIMTAGRVAGQQAGQLRVALSRKNINVRPTRAAFLDRSIRE